MLGQFVDEVSKAGIFGKLRRMLGHFKDFFKRDEHVPHSWLVGLGSLIVVLGVLVGSYSFKADEKTFYDRSSTGHEIIVIHEGGSGLIPKLFVDGGIATAVSGVVGWILSFRAWRKAEDNKGDFKKFFGDRIHRLSGSEYESIPAVFLHAKPAKFVGSEVGHGQLSNIELADPPEDSKGALPEGPNSIAIYQDVQGALILSRELSKFGVRLEIKADEYKANALPSEGCFAIGLGFNNVTRRLSREVCPGLYTITYPEIAGEGDSSDRTDDFYLNEQGGEGKEAEQVVGLKTDTCDYALVARIVRHSQGNSPIIYFVCAGRTAKGTVFASTYLANNWKELLNRWYTQTEPGKPPCRLDEDSVAIMLEYKTDREGNPTGDPSEKGKRTKRAPR